MLQNTHPGGLDFLACSSSLFSMGLHYPVANLKLPLGSQINECFVAERDRKAEGRGKKGGKERGGEFTLTLKLYV